MQSRTCERPEPSALGWRLGMSASTVLKSSACMKPMIIHCVRLSDRRHAAPGALSSPHALRHEAILGRTVKRLAVRAHCFTSASVPFALLDEAHLSSALKRLTVAGLASRASFGRRVSPVCPLSKRDNGLIVKPASKGEKPINFE